MASDIKFEEVHNERARIKNMIMDIKTNIFKIDRH